MLDTTNQANALWIGGPRLGHCIHHFQNSSYAGHSALTDALSTVELLLALSSALNGRARTARYGTGKVEANAPDVTDSINDSAPKIMTRALSIQHCVMTCHDTGCTPSQQHNR